MARLSESRQATVERPVHRIGQIRDRRVAAGQRRQVEARFDQLQDAGEIGLLVKDRPRLRPWRHDNHRHAESRHIERSLDVGENWSSPGDWSSGWETMRSREAGDNSS